MIKFKCPKCGHSQIYARRDGTSRCVYCNHQDKTEKFLVKEKTPVK